MYVSLYVLFRWIRDVRNRSSLVIENYVPNTYLYIYLLIHRYLHLVDKYNEQG